jgi:hypothetical protein
MTSVSTRYILNPPVRLFPDEIGVFAYVRNITMRTLPSIEETTLALQSENLGLEPVISRHDTAHELIE